MSERDDDDQHQSVPPVRVYAIAYIALMVLLALTVAAAFMPSGRGWGVGVALTIALAKGLLILLYFMHVRYSARMVWAFAGAGFLWLGIMFTLTFSDYLTRNHPTGANPKGEPRYLHDPRLSQSSRDKQTRLPQAPQ